MARKSRSESISKFLNKNDFAQVLRCYPYEHKEERRRSRNDASHAKNEDMLLYKPYQFPVSVIDSLSPSNTAIEHNRLSTVTPTT